MIVASGLYDFWSECARHTFSGVANDKDATDGFGHETYTTYETVKRRANVIRKQDTTDGISHVRLSYYGTFCKYIIQYTKEKPMEKATSKRCRWGLRKTKPLKKLIKFLLNLCATARVTGGTAKMRQTKRNTHTHPHKIVNYIFFPCRRIASRGHFDFDKSFEMFCAFVFILCFYWVGALRRISFPSTRRDQILLSFISWHRISSYSNRAARLFTRQLIFLAIFFLLPHSISRNALRVVRCAYCCHHLPSLCVYVCFYHVLAYRSKCCHLRHLNQLPATTYSSASSSFFPRFFSVFFRFFSLINYRLFFFFLFTFGIKWNYIDIMIK